MRVFVTGASGWIGSAVVPELIDAGHEVVGLARSDASGQAITTAGAEVLPGTLDDLETLQAAAADSDGVIHLAFKHESAFSGDFQGAADADRRAVEALGEALAGSDRPFLIASGTVGLAPGRVATEEDGRGSDPAAAALGGGPLTRLGTAQVTLALTSHGVRSSVVRLPPTCHGDGDNGFMATLVGIAPQRAPRATWATGPTAGRRPTASMRRGCSAWHWRRPRPDRRSTRSLRKACRSEGSPR